MSFVHISSLDNAKVPKTPCIVSSTGYNTGYNSTTPVTQPAPCYVQSWIERQVNVSTDHCEPFRSPVSHSAHRTQSSLKRIQHPSYTELFRSTTPPVVYRTQSPLKRIQHPSYTELFRSTTPPVVYQAQSPSKRTHHPSYVESSRGTTHQTQSPPYTEPKYDPILVTPLMPTSTHKESIQSSLPTRKQPSAMMSLVPLLCCM